MKQLKISNVLIVILLSLLSSITYAQIPNGSFEEWVPEESWENPVGWSTNNEGEYSISVSKVESISEGNYAMMVRNNGEAIFEGTLPGVASCRFFIDEEYDQLELNYKVRIWGGAWISIEIDHIDGAIREEVATWSLYNSHTEEIQSLILPFTRPISQEEILISIKAHSLLDGMGPGDAEIIVDGLRLTKRSTSTSELQADQIKIYPNPVHNILKIESDKIWDNYAIYDSKGVMIHSGRYADKINVSHLNAGLYFIEMYKREGTIYSSKFMKL